MMRTVFRLMAQGVRDLGLNPWAQVFTFAAVTLVAFLSGLFLMALTTVNHQLGTVRGEIAFQVYWMPGAEIQQIKEQWTEFRNLPGFSHVKTYTPEQALFELGTRLGREHGTSAKTFPFMDKNPPLPATALITFVPPEQGLDQWIEQTSTYLKGLSGVERVVTTPLKDELGQAWRKVSRYVMWPAITFLTLVLGLVVGNTIRLCLLARAHEVEILKLVGAYNWYIRLPLMVSGFLQGLAGGIVALVLLALVYSQIRNVLNFPPLLMEIQFLSWQLALALALVPAFMGMLASWVAVRD